MDASKPVPFVPRSPKRVAALVLALLCVHGVLRAAEPSADWPGWRGPGADGFATDKGLNKDWTGRPPRELWRAKLSSVGLSGISAADGLVFIMDHDAQQGVVRAFSLTDGREAWHFAFDDPEKKDDYGFDRATPVFDGGKVYCWSRFGRLFCIDARTGAKVWEVDTKDHGGRRTYYGHNASPVMDGEAVLVLAGAQDGCLMKFDKTTGKLLGKVGGDARPNAAPVVATLSGVKQYVVFSGARVVGIDSGSGAILWQHPWESESGLGIATPLVVDNSVFVTGGYGHNCDMLDITGGSVKVRYERPSFSAEFSSPILRDGFIYGNTLPSHLTCLEASTGRVKWKAPNFGWGGVVGLDGALIAVNGDTGEVVLVKLDPGAFTELGRLKPFDAKGQYWSPPIIAGGKLLLRAPSEIVCFDLR